MKKSLLISLLVCTNTICFSQPFNSQRLDSLFRLLEENHTFMGNIAVAQNGKLLYAKAIGFSDVTHSTKAGIHTKYRVGSISKMFTAALILKAMEEKRLSLDLPLGYYFPEIQQSEKITIGHLLRHKSGIHDFTNDSDYLSFHTQPQSERQMIERMAKGKSEFEPGSRVAYSNANYILLSYVLQKVYKKSYAAIVHAGIVKPLKLKHTYFGNKIQIKKKEGYSYHFKKGWIKGMETDLSIPLGAGGMVSTPADLNTFIAQLFAGNIISKASLAVMKTTEAYRGIGIGAGMLAFTNFEKKNYGHNGAIDDFTSLLQYFPDEKLSIAITSNGLRYPIDKVMLCALSCSFDQPFTLPTFNYVVVEPALLHSYAGAYASKQVPFKIDITEKEGQLFGQVKGQPAFALEASAKNMFGFEQAGLLLEFDAGKRQMILNQGGQAFLFFKD